LNPDALFILNHQTIAIYNRILLILDQNLKMKRSMKKTIIILYVSIINQIAPLQLISSLFSQPSPKSKTIPGDDIYHIRFKIRNRFEETVIENFENIDDELIFMHESLKKTKFFITIAEAKNLILHKKKLLKNAHSFYLYIKSHHYEAVLRKIAPSLKEQIDKWLDEIKNQGKKFQKLRAKHTFPPEYNEQFDMPIKKIEELINDFQYIFNEILKNLTPPT